MEQRPIHFEFYSSDPAASAAFFEQALGWSFQRWGGFDYWVADTGEEPPGINGAVGLAEEGVEPYTINTGQVPDLESAVEACEQAGGARIGGVREIPGVGRHTRIREPGGNLFGLIEPARHERG